MGGVDIFVSFLISDICYRFVVYSFYNIHVCSFYA
jgi:hypothetical protein